MMAMSDSSTYVLPFIPSCRGYLLSALASKAYGLLVLPKYISGSCARSELMTSDYVPLVNLISVFFQIRDDYMNLQSTEVSNITDRQ
jgi:hypothetical protein